jgi:2-oxoglutarate dehydrogenase E1 component
MVLLLPHGYEGQGPDHSSARIERFLILCAEDNIQVTNATTSAQYFHLLRRQMHREVRKPLIIFTPKSLLRAKSARSPLSALAEGSFQEVLDDPTVDPEVVTRVVLCSGKVGHDAIAHRDEANAPVAVVRVEQLFPWPEAQIVDILTRYPNANEVVWLQEEPENMGPWMFVHNKLHKILREDYRFRHVSRPESGSPATGTHAIHVQEQQQILDRAIDVSAT